MTAVKPETVDSVESAEPPPSNSPEVEPADDSTSNAYDNIKIGIFDILVHQPFLKPFNRLLAKRTGRLRIQRIIYFMGTFSIGHSVLMLTSFLPPTGLVDAFDSRLDYMKFSLFLSDLTLFTMLNHILGKDSNIELLDTIWDRMLQQDKDIPIKRWIIDRVKFIRKRLYLLIFLNTLIYLQLMVSVILGSAGAISLTFLLDLVHCFIDLIAIWILLVVLYQFLIASIFSQSIFNSICQEFTPDQRSSPMPSTSALLAQRNRYCTNVEFTRAANGHWKVFLLLFILSNFVPALFQLHFILNKELETNQFLQLSYRFTVNIVSSYIVLANAKRVNYFSSALYDDLYDLTLKEGNMESRMEALLFLDRVDHGNIGFTLGDSFLITPNLMSTLFSGLIILVFVLPSIA